MSRRTIKYIIYGLLGLPLAQKTFAQQAYCRKVLELTFANYNFIDKPVKPGQVYLLQTTTSIENASGGDEDKNHYASTFYMGHQKNVMISKEAELYEDDKLSIRIYPREHTIYIYKKRVQDSVKDKNIDMIMQSNLRLLESLAGLPCTNPSGDLVRFETGISDSSYIRKKIIDIDKDRHAFKNYTVYTNEADGSSRKIYTVYTKSELVKEEEFMKGDFIYLVYDRSNKVIKKYNNYKIIDHRNN